MLTVRPEVTDRTLIFSGRPRRPIMTEYEAHYNGQRPHRSRQIRPSRPVESVAGLSQERIRHRPVLGGLITEYQRAT
jgi:putative transposase